MIKVIIAITEDELNEKMNDFVKDHEVVNKYFSITNNGAYCFAIEYKEVSNERAVNTRSRNKKSDNPGDKKPGK